MTQKEFDTIHKVALVVIKEQYPKADWSKIGYTMSVHSKKDIVCSRKLGCINLTTGQIRYTPMLLDEYVDQSMNTIMHELYHWAMPKARHGAGYKLMARSLERCLVQRCIQKNIPLPDTEIARAEIKKIIQSTPVTPNPKSEQAQPTMKSPDELASSQQTWAIKCITWVDIRNVPAFKGLTKAQADTIIKALNSDDVINSGKVITFNGYHLSRKAKRR